MSCEIYRFILIFLLTSGIHCQGPHVQIPQGNLVGDVYTNQDGGSYYAFKSLPYGKPPLEKLRFKAPEPAEGWDGLRDATVELPQCRQRKFSILGRTQAKDDELELGQEDCLYLNIYTPGLPAENITNKAVMVWIFGGRFIEGSAQEYDYGANLLLTKDIVLVVMNYRVGSYGFLTLDDPDLGVTGNAGLKDQVLALQWVNENIEYFGGDPNNIVIFGESAGAISVHFHLLSPMSRGLFHKAICESAVSIIPDAFGSSATGTRNTALMIAGELGIQTDNWEEMLASLQEVTAEELYETEIALVLSSRDVIAPLVEIPSNNGPTFLEESPIDILNSGDIFHVPFMVGFNNAEGLALLQDADEESTIIQDLSAYIPPDLEIEPGSEAEEDVIQRIRDFYYDGGLPSRENVTFDIEFFTDWVTTYPIHRAMTIQLKTTPYPIYLYYFSADTQLNFKYIYPTMAAHPGASHMDEIGYLFNRYYTPDIESGSVEDVGWRNMVDLWTNFAIHGNPTPDGSEYTWKPAQEFPYNYLHIATEGSYPSSNLLPESIQFWDQIYEDYYPTSK